MYTIFEGVIYKIERKFPGEMFASPTVSIAVTSFSRFFFWNFTLNKVSPIFYFLGKEMHRLEWSFQWLVTSLKKILFIIFCNINCLSLLKCFKLRTLSMMYSYSWWRMLKGNASSFQELSREIAADSQRFIYLRESLVVYNCENILFLSKNDSAIDCQVRRVFHTL